MDRTNIGHYRLDGLLGEGGMGIVWAGFDTRLSRPVAVKVVRRDLASPELRERFWREARAAAALNHPNVCQVHDIGEEGGNLFIVMERLEGEPLSERISRAPLAVAEAVAMGLGLLDALGLLHASGFVHRDLKPSNIFLVPDGRAKLLDFGLVRVAAGSGETDPGLTHAGSVMGTPSYMSPEQVRGEEVDGRSDLFSLGTVLWESLAGRPAFRRASIPETLTAVLRDDLPPLADDGPLAAVDAALRRAIARDRDARYASAAEMAEGLRAAGSSGVFDRTIPSGLVSHPSPRAARPPRRLAVLPFRLMRPDPALDFLPFSLADAIALSLSAFDQVLVRSSALSSQFDPASGDMATVAARLDVDVVVLGTILAAGGRCRVSAQLVEAPGGKVVATSTSDADVGDVFGLMDQITRRIVDALALPLTGSGRFPAARDVPKNPEAFGLFLRANQAAMVGEDLTLARGLYARCLEIDPAFAPAWARLGRLHHILGKYGAANREANRKLAEDALEKALEINPDLGAAHLLFAQIEAESGRVEEATERLLDRVARHPAEPDAWAGLVLSLRFLGLVEASLDAHERAEKLDPDVRTSVFHTFLSAGDADRALAQARRPKTFNAYEESLALQALRRDDEALAVARAENERRRPESGLDWGLCTVAVLTGDRPGALEAIRRLRSFPDPEGLYLLASGSARLGETSLSADLLDHAVRGGYVNVPRFERDPWLGDKLARPEFARTMAEARARHERARARFGNAAG